MDKTNGIEAKETDYIEKRGHELLPLTNDRVFRRVFAMENPDALADFIFCVTGMPIEGIVVDDPHLYAEDRDGKQGELDVRVHTKSGATVNVEIQVRNEEAFRERIIYYSDRLFASQIKKGDSYGALNKTISIIITDFVLFGENREHFNTFKWYNISNRTLLSDMQEIHTLELPKLPRADDRTRLWRWLRLMKARKENEMEALAKGSHEMGKVVVTVRQLSADERAERLAEAEHKRQWSMAARRDYDIKEGIGIGEKQKAIVIARQMKADGMDAATISKYTGISEDEL
jgi:predicted transposase/invertase (TIGR01784 family)